MKVKLIYKKKGLIPLSQNNEEIICQKKNTIIQFNIKTKHQKLLFKLPGSFLDKLLCSFFLTARLFRKNCIWLIELDKNKYLFSNRKGVFLFDPKGVISSEHVFEKDKYFLKFCFVKNMSEFNDGIYAGEYYSNPNFSETSIWFRNTEEQWSIVYTFQQGEINHIHGLYEDKQNNCLWIMTGDFEKGPALWKATKNFMQVEKFTPSDQKFRACWMKAFHRSLYWATDTQLEKNKILMLNNIEADKNPITIQELPGSSIYSSDLIDKIVFSTTLEPERANRKKLRTWLDNKPAKALEINGAAVYLLLQSGTVINVLRDQAHRLPLRLFEYPTYLLPYNYQKSNYFSCYGRSVKNNENTLLIYFIEE